MMMTVILGLLKALNMISDKRWTIELDGKSVLFKEWDQDLKNCIASTRIDSYDWMPKMKECVQLAIIREATPKEPTND